MKAEVRRALCVLALVGAMLSFATPALACNRDQCKMGITCYECDNLIILAISCFRPLCFFCENKWCVTAGEEEVAGLELTHESAQCSAEEPAEAQEPTATVMEVAWVPART